MDIDLLSRIVKELITDHDKVGLPGLGTFVAEVVPASFSDKGYTINPPYRRLSFHPDNTEADLLVKFYSDSNHVPLEASRVYITEFLSELKQVLIQRKTVIFPGLGRLRATKENNFFFVPDEDLDIYPDGFGLQPVSMKYIQGVADPVDIKLSYSDAMRGFEDRHRAAEPMLQAEPVQLVAEEQSAAGEPQLETLSPDQAEPVQPSEPGQSSESELTSEPKQPVEPDQAEQEQPSEDPSERQCDTALAELPGGERDAASAELQGEERGAAPAEQLLGEERDAAPAEQLQGEERDAASAELPGGERDAPAEQLHGAESDTALVKLPGGERGAASAELPGEETGDVRRRCRWWIAPVVVLSLAVVALGVFVILAHAAPDFIDSILYTPEELKILNY